MGGVQGAREPSEGLRVPPPLCPPPPPAFCSPSSPGSQREGGEEADAVSPKRLGREPARPGCAARAHGPAPRPQAAEPLSPPPPAGLPRRPGQLQRDPGAYRVGPWRRPPGPLEKAPGAAGRQGPWSIRPWTGAYTYIYGQGQRGDRAPGSSRAAGAYSETAPPGTAPSPGLQGDSAAARGAVPQAGPRTPQDLMRYVADTWLIRDRT